MTFRSVIATAAAAAASCALLLSSSVEAKVNATSKRILIVGDSWGTISPATEHFQAKLKEHNCDSTHGFTNIAVAGTTAEQWSRGSYLDNVKKQAPEHDEIWVTLMGNDALEEMPGCARTGKNASACGDELMVSCTQRMTTILDTIHAANPDAKVVGFGYDIMFGGFGCSFAARSIFPQCWKESNPTRCFNTQLIRIQELWENLAKKYEFVTAINILGTTQVAGGDTVAKIGQPNLDKMGPSKYWPIWLQCFHPSTSGGDGSGAMVIMEQFYQQYWKDALQC